MDANTITTELKKYQPTDATIAKWEEYKNLTIDDLEDKVAFRKVHEARVIVRDGRIQVENIRKDLKAEALEYGRKVDGEAKRLFALIEPIEDHLKAEEKKIEDEQERLRVEHEQAEKKQIEERVNLLLKHGMKPDIMASLDNPSYEFQDFKISVDEVRTISAAGFNKFIEDVSIAKRADDEKIAEEEKKKKDEAKALEVKAKEQEKKEAELKAREEELQKKEIEAQKQKEIKEAIAKVNKEAEDKAFAEIEEARLAGEKTDKNEKYIAFLKKHEASKDAIDAGEFRIEREGSLFKLYKFVDVIDIK